MCWRNCRRDGKGNDDGQGDDAKGGERNGDAGEGGEVFLDFFFFYK